MCGVCVCGVCVCVWCVCVGGGGSARARVSVRACVCACVLSAVQCIWLFCLSVSVCHSFSLSLSLSPVSPISSRAYMTAVYDVASKTARYRHGTTVSAEASVDSASDASAVLTRPCMPVQRRLKTSINRPCSLHCSSLIVQELCESRGGRPGLFVLTSLLVSVDVKNYRTVLRHWSQLAPNMSTDICGH